MKTKFLSILLGFSNLTFAQNVIISKNYDPAVPVNTSALLTLNSDNQGLLLPRVSNKETTVTFPPAGLMLYDNENSKVSYYNGSQWNNLGENTIIPSTFQRAQAFQPPYYNEAPAYVEYSFTVPAGISKVWIEAWGGGKQSDSIYPSTQRPGSTLWGGTGGDYVSFTMDVAPTQVLRFNISKGGNSAMNPKYFITEIFPYNGGGDKIEVAAGGENGVQVIGNTTFFIDKFIGGEKGSPDELSPFGFSSIASNGIATQYMVYKYIDANGGSSYPGQSGGKGSNVCYFLNGNTPTLWSARGETSIGSSPGGGGGAYFSGNKSMGGPGLVIVHW